MFDVGRSMFAVRFFVIHCSLLLIGWECCITIVSLLLLVGCNIVELQRCLSQSPVFLTVNFED